MSNFMPATPATVAMETTTSLVPVLLTMYIILAIISAIGKEFIVDIAWRIFSLLPTRTRKHLDSRKSLQSSLLATSASLKSTSSQDEFAKWARLNRLHDKQIEDLKKLNTLIDAEKKNVKRVVGVLFFLGTTGIKGGVQWWFSREAVFWLPAGTFPGWVEWVVSFPKAPRGSVSTMVFGLCANRVIGFAVGFVKDVAVARKMPVAVDVSGSSSGDEKSAAGSRFEEVTTEEEKKSR